MDELDFQSPSLTAFHLVHYNKKTGGPNRVISILEDCPVECRGFNQYPGGQHTG